MLAMDDREVPPQQEAAAAAGAVELRFCRVIDTGIESMGAVQLRGPMPPPPLQADGDEVDSISDDADVERPQLEVAMYVAFVQEGQFIDLARLSSPPEAEPLAEGDTKGIAFEEEEAHEEGEGEDEDEEETEEEEVEEKSKEEEEETEQADDDGEEETEEEEVEEKSKEEEEEEESEEETEESEVEEIEKDDDEDSYNFQVRMWPGHSHAVLVVLGKNFITGLG